MVLCHGINKNVNVLIGENTNNIFIEHLIINNFHVQILGSIFDVSSVEMENCEGSQCMVSVNEERKVTVTVESIGKELQIMN